MDNKFLNKATTLVFYFSILIFIIAFNFSDNRSGGWYQQFLPNMNGANITDMTFTDSLNGYEVTNIGGGNSYILKTTNGGDNWEIKFTNNRVFNRIEFINSNTGFTNAFTTLYKTTNSGENWNAINLPGIFGDDMFVLNEDTIWLAMSESLTGGVYHTTNGGTSWQRQLNLGSLNPDHIYMYNKDIGFISRVNSGAPYTRKTTDGGQSWFVVVNNEAFTDMYFADSLTGWRAWNTMLKTYDGGIRWINQSLPNTYFSQILRFSNVNRDTIYGVNGIIAFPNNQMRAIIYKTTNSGNNWGYQVPDTNIHIFEYYHSKFINKLNGWSYALSSGVHTMSEGDTTFYTLINQSSNEIPIDFILGQNYPNPFNPKTKFKFVLSKKADIVINIFDISGKQLETIVKSTLNAGEYEAEFNAVNYSSGIYFYSLIVDGKVIDTKRMILLK